MDTSVNGQASPGLAWREIAGVSAVAAVLTLILAMPVLRAPSERIFGSESVGRHRDPFVMMEQFGGPVTIGVYSQPATDLAGALFARVVGRVASYNLLVLLTFPLAAAAAYALAKHLGLSRPAAAIAAVAFAFSPFHLTQAAYHVHIAQTQWIPLYLLALWRCLDRATPTAVAVLGLAAAGVALSNFYGGLIAALVTPTAIVAYWVVRRPWTRRSTPRLGITLLALAVIAAGGLAYAGWAAPSVVARPGAFAFPYGDLSQYGARWWSYFVPALANPWWGEFARRLWITSGTSVGMLEQQVTIGWAVCILGAVALWARLSSRGRPASLWAVPLLAAIGLTAFVCSLTPDAAFQPWASIAPARVVHPLLPMFRAYARFGVVVQLAAVLLAGIGADHLRAGGRTARAACGALLVIALAEYTVWPGALWRDVLPTEAHRWVAHSRAAVKVADCAPLTLESSSIQWLAGGKIWLFPDDSENCAEPNLPLRLAATGYTHLLVRAGTEDGHWLAPRARAEGLLLRARFYDGSVWAIVASPPSVYTAQMIGFWPREFDAASTWRWMGRDGSWSVVNPTLSRVVASLEIEMRAFPASRHVEIGLDGHAVHDLVVGPDARSYAVGPLDLSPGAHQLTFRAIDPPVMGDAVEHNGDRRALAIAVGAWTWTGRRDEPPSR